MRKIFCWFGYHKFNEVIGKGKRHCIHCEHKEVLVFVDMNMPIWLKVLSLLFISCLCLQAAEIKFQWSANTETNLGGYRMYYGPTNRTYIDVLTIGRGLTNITVSLDLTNKTYFALSAFNMPDNIESDLTPDLVWIPSMINIVMTFQTSTNLTFWNNVVSYTNTIPKTNSSSFYRVKLSID